MTQIFLLSKRKQWPMTTLRDRLVKIGARIVRPGMDFGLSHCPGPPMVGQWDSGTVGQWDKGLFVAFSCRFPLSPPALQRDAKRGTRRRRANSASR